MNREEIPRKYRGLYDKAKSSTSRKAAIRFHCLECVAFMPKEVELCTSKGCVLYKYRLKG